MAKWKTIAIVFIILFVLETLLLIGIYQAGVESVENDKICAVNICEGTNNVNYDTYFYESATKTCYCYKNHILVYNEVIK